MSDSEQVMPNTEPAQGKPVPRVDTPDDHWLTRPATIRKLWIAMYRLKKQPVLNDANRRRDFIEALSVCFDIPPKRADKQPSIDLKELADDYAFAVFKAAWDDVIDDVHGMEREQP